MKYTVITEENLNELLDQKLEEISGFEFQKLNLSDANFKGALFVDCKFTGCNFANASLLNTALRSVAFEECNLMGINWTDLRKNGSYSFSGCKLDYGCFQNMDLRNYEFLDCSIREADFSGANLEKAKITNCILSGTSFANVNLEKADLRNSKSYFIDPKYAKLKQAKFTLPEAVILLEAMGIEVGY